MWLSHSARLPHHLVTVGVSYGQDLRFDNNRLTVSTSVANSYWEGNSPASLARFPCKLDLMPIRCGLCNRFRQGQDIAASTAMTGSTGIAMRPFRRALWLP